MNVRCGSAIAGLVAIAGLIVSGCSSPTRPAPLLHGRIVGTLSAQVFSHGGWSPQNVYFLTSLRGFVTVERCSPNGGSCLSAVGRTEDGGRSFFWTALGKGTPEGITFADFQHGWILVGDRTGTAERLVGTTNGGTTWRVLTATPPMNGLPDFVSATLGYAIAPGPTSTSPLPQTALVRTQDGGRTWRTFPTDGYAPGDVDFVGGEMADAGVDRRETVDVEHDERELLASAAGERGR